MHSLINRIRTKLLTLHSCPLPSKHPVLHHHIFSHNYCLLYTKNYVHTIHVIDLGKLCKRSTRDSWNTRLVAQVEICQSPDFIIYMSNNPSSNCCRHLRRLVTLYKCKISLHFDPPNRHSGRTWSPLLWVLIRIPSSGLQSKSKTFNFSL